MSYPIDNSYVPMSDYRDQGQGDPRYQNQNPQLNGFNANGNPQYIDDRRNSEGGRRSSKRAGSGYNGRMHQKQILTADELPVPDSERTPTDVCCAILGILFGLFMFIAALIAYNQKKLAIVNYPADRKGNICQGTWDDSGINYPFVYFNDIEDPLGSRYCVRECPQKGIRPQCYEKNCPLVYYPNYPLSNSLGEYCLPEDENEKNQLLYKANLYERWNSQRAIEFLLWGVLISVVLSLIVMLLALFLPKLVIWIVTVLAIILLVICAIVFLVNNNTTLRQGSGWAIFAGVLCIIMILILILYLVLHMKKISISGTFMKYAATFLKKNPLMFLYIPVYVGLTFLFGLLTVFEYMAFNSISDYYYEKDSSVFYKLKKQWVWIFFLAFQTIWGLSFFRDSFNYIISSTAAEYFFIEGKQKSDCCQYQKKCLKFNFGSIVGGSLINGFFYFPSLIISLLCSKIDCCCCNLFDLVRTDVYSYIGLTGNSYCPSVRQCQYLCYRSHVCRANESTNAFYSLAARIFVACASILIVYWIARDNLVGEKIPPYLLLGIFFIALFISCYFVDIQIYACQGILTAFLAQIEMDQVGYNGMYIPNDNMDGLREDITKLQKIQGKYQTGGGRGHNGLRGGIDNNLDANQ